MNEQEIKLPQLPPLAGLEIAITLGPGYIGKLMQGYARETVRMNQQAPTQAEPERRPFNLEAARRGEPLVTRDGRPARFVAYVPEDKHYPVVAVVDNRVTTYSAEGVFQREDCASVRDLFMAPKPKRTVWANTYYHDTKESALMRGKGATLVAVPVEIDA